MSIGRRRVTTSQRPADVGNDGLPTQASKKASKQRKKPAGRTRSKAAGPKATSPKATSSKTSSSGAKKAGAAKSSKPKRKPDNPSPQKVRPADIDGGSVIEALSSAAAPVDERELGDMLGAGTSGARRKLGRVLMSMADEGTVIVNRRGLYALPERMDIMAGRIIGHADGFGFVSSGNRATDLFLPPRQMRKVMHGDRVLARVTSVDSRGRPGERLWLCAA